MTVQDFSKTQARVLFVCTGNSCRSQMAEGLARALGEGRIASFSAGSDPRPVHPLAVRTMSTFGVDISQQRSKDLDEFSGESFDYVITLCDRAKEKCPVWAGAKEQIHWSVEDPAAVEGPPERQSAAFGRVATELKKRIELFIAASRL